MSDSHEYTSVTLGHKAILTANGGGIDYHIESLTLGSESVLRLAAGDYWVGTLVTNHRARIEVVGGGQVRLFVRDTLNVGSSVRFNSPEINSAGDADKLFLYAYEEISLNNGATISGYLYSAVSRGANASVTLGSASYVFGAITAENVVLGTNSRVTYQAPSGNCGAAAQLVLSWSLDERSWSGTAGEVRDGSGNGLHGQAVNGAVTNGESPKWPTVNGEGTCRYGQFDRASSHYLQTAHDDALTQEEDFTVGLWIRPRSYPASGLMSVLSKDENYEFHLKPNGTINWWWQTTTGATREFDSTSSVALGQWSHVLIRYTATEQRIYINGTLAGTANLSGTPRANADPLQLGWDQIAGRHFDGDLDELRIYKGALGQEQITALVNERHPCETNLQCFSNFLEPSTFASNWAVSSRGLSHFVPQLVDGRMRLTSNAGNVATAAALQRLFPAEGQFIQVSFRHYAYDGNGADGIALILSDASVTPQPGGYGGSLGYAQLNGQSGFAGGWLGVAIDEYGNFSTFTEGRVGGLGRNPVPDTVSVRGPGAGTTGYQYLTGTPSGLDPEIDATRSRSPAPGHVYRITIDGRTTNQARLTVERDTGSGFRVLPNLDAVDVLSLNGQTALPENLYLSFTGSTGGQNNIHELEELEVCAADIRPLTARIHHFELNYAPTALTCSPHAVTIRACMDEACSTTYQEPVSVALQPVVGWTADNPVRFSGGSTILHLRSNNPGTVQLGVSESTPQTQSFSQTVCSTANCEVVFADSGFVFDVPNLIAARPESGIALQAVKKDDRTQACVPGFDDGGKRTLQFSSSYVNPDTGTRQVVVNDTPVGASPTDIELTFDSEARASLEISYADAGVIDLLARYAPAAGEEKGLVMTGADQLASRPYGLCLLTEADQADGGAACESDDLDCPAFQHGGVPVRAGDPFRLLVRPVGWEANEEPLTAEQLCDGNLDTPNFEMAGIEMTHELFAPEKGDRGELAVTRFDHPRGGEAAVHGQAYTEVGIIRISATPKGSYFGETVSGGESNRVGRFTPAYLGASGAASLRPSCGTFSYQGQPMEFAATGEPTLTVSGYSRAGAITRNYDLSPFWRLPEPSAPDYLSQTGRAGIDARLEVVGTAKPAVSGADDGDGIRGYRWTGQQLRYAPALTALVEDLPFPAEVDMSFSAASLTDDDDVCIAGEAGCQGYKKRFDKAPGSEVRLGRLRIENAHGSELQSLPLPLLVETWRDLSGARFAPETEDACTTPVELGSVNFISYSDALSPGDTAATVASFRAGGGQLTLSPPGAGNHGSARLDFPALADWLKYGWEGAVRRSAVGVGTFGIYQGSKPLIFRRELYR
ncbi:DUF6701 domain-containing protein [Stutzerimonas xanthomarina]|uniref:DUF6701 domain-containing protein n=1 Tax=Stutzerimonas xanthomarina TaxID=271420 RepID=UPI0029A99F36|nr:DUF6701 domain-containing protein [Stutzerimonas xanthomarina]MDX2352705.1 hypothetical protein [Stutzerimonas xanthomarina]